MLLGALAEGFGLLMIVPLASLAIGDGMGEMPFLQALPREDAFMLALGLFLGAMGARALLLYARDTTLIRLQADYEASLRLRAAATLASRGWGQAARIGQAGMQSLLLNDVPRSANAVHFAQQLAAAAAMLLAQLALTTILSPRLTAVALAMMAAGALLTLRWTRRGVDSGRAITDSLDQATGSGFRLHAGLKAALAQGTVPAFLEEYRVSLGRSARQLIRYGRDYSTAQQLAALGAAVAATVLLFVGVRLLALPFPVLAASLVLFARMSGPAQRLQLSLQELAAHAPAFAAIERRLGRLERKAPAVSAAPEPLEWSELVLDLAGFEHQRGLGLDPTSLRLCKGQWLGVCGPSGVGKTTLLDIAAGLLAPDRGEVLVDGRPLEGETLERWRASLSYVAQEGAVFSDSVRGNLLAEGAGAGDAELWDLLDLVGLAGRVRAFTAELDEQVGDRGSILSGGERQRLALARALLRRPRLLILDEATAALDPDSEARVLGAVRARFPDMAAMIVAHRESTLGHCDSRVTIAARGDKAREKTD